MQDLLKKIEVEAAERLLLPPGRLAAQELPRFRAFLKHDQQVEMVTFWGVNDAVSWRAQGRPLLFDGNNQPKPAFDAVIGEAKPAAGNR